MTADHSRYDRQMRLPGIGEAGQRRLGDATALLLGCGALGTVAADLLTRAGVGHLVVVDRDFVELSNLQRQVLFDEQDVADGLPKAVAAERKLARINSGVRVTAIVDDINRDNIAGLAREADVLVDGLDNFETRYLANDLAVRDALPYVYGAAVGTTGMAFAVMPHGDGKTPWESHDGDDLATPCFRCLFEEAPPPGTSATCETAGVIAPAVSIVASFQVAEAIKILTGNYDRVSRTRLTLDLWSNETSQLRVDASYEKGDCPCCRGRRFDYLEGDAGSSATTLCGRNAVQLRHRRPSAAIDLRALASRLATHGRVTVNEFMLRAHIDDGDGACEIALFPDGRAIVQGTADPSVARSLYAKYIGS